MKHTISESIKPPAVQGKDRVFRRMASIRLYITEARSPPRSEPMKASKTALRAYA